MGKSLIYCANVNSQTINANDTVNFGNVVRRFGNIGSEGGNIVTNEAGYYTAFVNLTVAGTAAGSTTFQVNYNGVPVSGGKATTTTSATSINSLCIPVTIRQNCCCSRSITVTASGTTVNVTNAAIEVVKE